MNTDLLLFAFTATLITMTTKSNKASATKAEGDCKLVRNSAFVFVKPHANTPDVQKLVREKLCESGCQILSETDIDGPTIDQKKLIDQHYYSIASKATILPAKDIPVPKDKFQDSFNESWDQVLAEGRACNAMDACQIFRCDAAGLDEAWQKAKVVKFGGGFYCGLVTIGGKSLYVFNAFFMSMRSKFVGKNDSIHCYEVVWDPTHLSWSDFRSKVLGPTDPNEAPVGSLRRTILDNYQSLGLAAVPNKGDNGVHASASPFEGLAEKINWLRRPLESDDLGKALLAAGLHKATIEQWSVDPQVIISENGSKGSVFDALEDLDAEDCIAKLVQLNDWNNNTI